MPSQDVESCTVQRMPDEGCSRRVDTSSGGRQPEVFERPNAGSTGVENLLMGSLALSGVLCSSNPKSPKRKKLRALHVCNLSRAMIVF